MPATFSHEAESDRAKPIMHSKASIPQAPRAQKLWGSQQIWNSFHGWRSSLHIKTSWNSKCREEQNWTEAKQTNNWLERQHVSWEKCLIVTDFMMVIFFIHSFHLFLIFP